MLETAPQPTKFNRRGLYIAYAGEGRATVYVQDGMLYAEDGTDLMHGYLTDPDRTRFKNILYWMNFMGYAMNAELRHEVVKLRREQELQERMKSELARLDEMQAVEMAQLEKELADAQRQARLKSMPALPPDVQSKVIPELELTDTEKAVLGQDFELQDPTFDEDFGELDEPEEDPEPVAPAPALKAATKKATTKKR